MSYTAEDVKRLREKTGGGLLDCKKALEATDGDFDAAVDYLRKKGLATAASKSGRAASEGAVIASVCGNKGALIEINSETDFVARNEDFQKVAAEIALIACDKQIDAEALKKLPFPGTTYTIEEEITHLVSKIKENIMLRREEHIEVHGGVICHYIHGSFGPNMGKIGVLVAVESDATDKDRLRDIGKKVAMHIAATKPKSLGREDLSVDFINKEKEILREQVAASGKPADVIEKMIEGRLRKLFEEVVLLEQPFVMDPKSTVGQFIEAQGKELGATVRINSFKLLVLGEGVEK